MPKLRILYGVLFIALVTLSGCGLTPVYGERTTQNNPSALLADIDIDIIPEEAGVNLRNELIDRMYTHGYPATPKYRLIVESITEVKAGVGIAKDASVTRSQLRQYSKMHLLDIESNTVVLNRDISAVTSYNVLESHFTTLVSEREARHNGVNELAEQIILQLELYFSSPDRQK